METDQHILNLIDDYNRKIDAQKASHDPRTIYLRQSSDTSILSQKEKELTNTIAAYVASEDYSASFLEKIRNQNPAITLLIANGMKNGIKRKINFHNEHEASAQKVDFSQTIEDFDAIISKQPVLDKEGHDSYSILRSNIIAMMLNDSATYNAAIDKATAGRADTLENLRAAEALLANNEAFKNATPSTGASSSLIENAYSLEGKQRLMGIMAEIAPKAALEHKLSLVENGFGAAVDRAQKIIRKESSVENIRTLVQTADPDVLPGAPLPHFAVMRPSLKVLA